MTTKEFAVILAIITNVWNISFAEYTCDASGNKIFAKNNIWYEILGDLDFSRVNITIRKLAETESFINPAKIRETYFNITKSNNNLDALIVINKALSMFGFNKTIEALEYIKANDNIAYEVVKIIGWRNICLSDANYFRTEFGKYYKQVADEYKENEMLSNDIKNQIGILKNALQKSSLNQLSGDI